MSNIPSAHREDTPPSQGRHHGATSRPWGKAVPRARLPPSLGLECCLLPDRRGNLGAGREGRRGRSHSRHPAPSFCSSPGEGRGRPRVRGPDGGGHPPEAGVGAPGPCSLLSSWSGALVWEEALLEFPETVTETRPRSAGSRSPAVPGAPTRRGRGRTPHQASAPPFVHAPGSQRPAT